MGALHPKKDIIMDTFFQALAAISGPLAGILAYMLIEGKRKAKTRAKADNEAETMLDDEVLIKKYVETVIRRTFGTKDAMKLAKPIPKE